MIIIKVENNIKYFINKCIKNNINLYNIRYVDDYIYATINIKDLENIKKLNYYSKIDIVEYIGLRKYYLILKKYFIDYIYLLLFLILIYFISNIIICVDIKHENTTIKEKVQNILLSYGIDKYKLYKSDEELSIISDEILKNNRDFLDFISITRVGMKYVINIEERKMVEVENETTYCHIKALKDGVVTSLNATSGVRTIEIGSSVKKEDILISGELTLNDEIKGNVCASGTVRANTWYKINVNYPLEETNKIYTNRKKINIKILGNYLNKRLYDSFDEKVLFKIGIIEIVRQDEYTLESITLDRETAKSEGIEEAINSLLSRINENSIILDKKVLKETLNNSTIELEIFVSVDEEIGYTSVYKESDISDTNEGI